MRPSPIDTKKTTATLDDEMQKFVAAGAQQAQTPPKPTPAELKAQSQQAQIQADMQQTQMQEQTKRDIAGLQAQIKGQDLQIKALEAQTKAKQVDAQIAHDQARTHIDVISNRCCDPQ